METQRVTSTKFKLLAIGSCSIGLLLPHSKVLPPPEQHLLLTWPIVCRGGSLTPTDARALRRLESVVALLDQASPGVDLG